MPFWNAKRAGLLAEIGEIYEAKKILEHSLQSIENQLDLEPDSRNYSLISEKSFVMFLLHYVQGSLTIRPRGGDEQQKYKQLTQKFLKQWDALKQYKCDPWNEFDLMKMILECPPKKTTYRGD